ncbi:PrgI family protein [Candidatus Gracilibacteria bacterium]|nr:PrgI family protein [Candidatus Gracilibacteria bacterium]MCF7898518.1 PrgI family protein [Candidatus Paceibacterota bacterium]
MQFRVPQFIDMEDKIIGPLTLKQFGYIVGAGGLSFIIWTFIPVKFIAVLVIIPVAGLFLALAFVKYNNRSFGELLESAFSYYTGAKVFTWAQPNPESSTQESHIDKIVADTTKQMIISKTDRDRIHDLSLGLDVFEHTQEKKEDRE